MSKYLKKITEYFPDWTKIYKDPDNSVGGRFINTFAQFLDNIDNIIQDMIYIDHLHIEEDGSLFEYEGLRLNKIDYISKIKYKAEDLFNTDGEMKIQKIVYNNQNVLFFSSVYELFSRDELGCFYDSTDEYFYFNKVLDKVEIDGLTVSCEPHHVWGPYDEIGLLIGLERQPNEKNKYYAYRLKEHYREFGNSSPDKLKSFIYRALIPFTSALKDLSEDSIQLQSLNLDYILNDIKDDGKISDELKAYINLSRKINKNYTNSYWDVIEVNNMGLKYLPISWYLTDNSIKEEYIQNGVLTPDSLEILAPELDLHPGDIDFKLTVKDIDSTQEEYFPETEFEYSVVYNEEVEGSSHPNEEYELEVTAYEEVNLEFDLVAKLLYENLTSTVFKPYLQIKKMEIETITDNEKYLVMDFNNPIYNYSIEINMVDDSEKGIAVEGDGGDLFNDNKSLSLKINLSDSSTSIEPDKKYNVILGYDTIDDSSKVLEHYASFNCTLNSSESGEQTFDVENIYVLSEENDMPLLGVNTPNKIDRSGQTFNQELKVRGDNDYIKIVDGTEVVFKDESANTARILIKLKSEDEKSPVFEKLTISYDNGKRKVKKDISVNDIISSVSNINIEKKYNINICEIENEEHGFRLADAKYNLNLAYEKDFTQEGSKFLNTYYKENSGIGLNLSYARTGDK